MKETKAEHMAQLVVALDVPQAVRAEQLIDELYELDLIYKIGMEPLYGYGGRIFSYMEARDVRHFLDAKLHDIPRTVAAGVTQLVRHGTHIIDVHALGGREMMRAAAQAAKARAGELGMTPPHVFAVTILTSMGAADVADVGLTGDPASSAMRLARLAKDAGCDGVVCSAHEVRGIKEALGPEFLTLTPGIRPAGADHGDQKRVTTPADAVAAGSDYLVVGRPITEAANPYAAAKAILDEMQRHASIG
jgi:orotidine-5'-phosphate decarboxylase